MLSSLWPSACCVVISSNPFWIMWYTSWPLRPLCVNDESTLITHINHCLVSSLSLVILKQYHFRNFVSKSPPGHICRKVSSFQIVFNLPSLSISTVNQCIALVDSNSALGVTHTLLVLVKIHHGSWKACWGACLHSVLVSRASILLILRRHPRGQHIYYVSTQDSS